MVNKVLDIVLPSVMSFGPIFLLIGIPTSTASYSAVIGAVTMSVGGCLLIGKMQRLEKRVDELESGPK